MTKRPDWDDLIAMAARGEKGKTRLQWEMGDELIRQIGRPSSDARITGSFAKLDDAKVKLMAAGYEYETQTLRNLWQTAAHFPVTFRKSLPWHCHHFAGTPEMLDSIVAGAPRNQKITQTYVLSVVRGLALRRQQELEEETERRQEAYDKAKAEREQAERDRDRARTAAERKAAAERADAAARRQKASGAPPKRKDMPPSRPKPEDVPMLVARAQFAADIGQVARGLRKLIETFTPLVPHFPDVDIDAAHERMMALTETARGFSELLRKRQAGKASHLSVVDKSA